MESLSVNSVTSVANPLVAASGGVSSANFQMHIHVSLRMGRRL